MIISIASGKGGTGKTTIAVNLAHTVESDVEVLDCDVEEPNCHLFLQPEITRSLGVFLPVPEVDQEKCTFCGRCAEVCRFNAIAVLADQAVIFAELCHGCGGCTLACPEKAITETKREIGTIEKGSAGHIGFVHGKLKVGVALSPPIIKAVKKEANPDKMTIIDAPPGTSCPVVASIHGTDFCVLVTEPTPFGLHDLILAVETVRKLEVPFGVVINRSGIEYPEIYRYLLKENIEILMEIPNDRRYAESYSKGKILVHHHKELKSKFIELLKIINEKVANLTGV